MNVYKPMLVILLLGGLVLVGSHYLPGTPKEVVPWRTDLTAASAEAKRLHKPLMVDFSATWCGPCQQMARTTWSDPKVAAALTDLVNVRIDVDQYQDVAQKYGVQSIPTYMILDANGDVKKIGQGYRSSERFLAWLHSPGDVPTTSGAAADEPE